jgi:hypothetical protein
VWRGIRYTIYDIRYTIYDIRYTIYDIRYTIYDIRYMIYDIRWGGVGAGVEWALYFFGTLPLLSLPPNPFALHFP